MLIKKENKNYEVFQYENYFVEIEETTKDNEILQEFWLYKDNYGIKMYMFGIKKDEDYINILINNLEEYIDIYCEDYEDYE